ncbi:MAG: hypothetical protein QNJ64_21280 [Crocosphaera sp.]|nr:hypothetical protein [Crocosphaera sp.]
MIINNLKKVINQKYELLINNDNPNDSSIIITEKHPEAKLKRVEIKGFNSSLTYGFKLDLDNERICNYFAPNASIINKACDGIIFTQLNEQNYIFLCELKSQRLKEEECVLKYKNSELFLDYLLNILKNFYEIDKSISFIYKYVLFDIKKNTKKNRKTLTKRQKVETEPFTYNQFSLDVYRIRDLTEPINIRHLQL